MIDSNYVIDVQNKSKLSNEVISYIDLRTTPNHLIYALLIKYNYNESHLHYLSVANFYPQLIFDKMIIKSLPSLNFIFFSPVI